jgi:hypothetical protein
VSAILTADGRDSRSLRWDDPPPLGLVAAPPSPSGRVWIGHSGKHNRISVIASVDGGSLHVSIAHSQRYPTWDEILAVRAWAFPDDVEVVMVLARKGEYVNLHNNCFHLWESACGREGR